MLISISRSLGRKLVATATAAVGFVLMYEAKVMDFMDLRSIERVVQRDNAALEAVLPAGGLHLQFTATAYCKGTTTASGVNVRTGIAAADPELLPVGSVIQIYKLGERYNGIYTIMDTGPAVQGRHIDIYMWSCNEALGLGRKYIAINVLRLGWNPKASTPTLIERFFRQREAARADADALLPSRPIEIK
ncbi:MAG TPA: 3D domain-containing protein [Vicinamibacterales bacterium]|nr:3D domain-containing protein [Vicinamibacterales bacterium]